MQKFHSRLGFSAICKVFFFPSFLYNFLRVFLSAIFPPPMVAAVRCREFSSSYIFFSLFAFLIMLAAVSMVVLRLFLSLCLCFILLLFLLLSNFFLRLLSLSIFFYSLSQSTLILIIFFCNYLCLLSMIIFSFHSCYSDIFIKNESFIIAWKIITASIC